MIELYFGKPGTGKTTLLVKQALQELKKIKKGKSKYKYVLSNVRIKGIIFVDFDSLSKYMFKDCLILLDEITLDADSREYKNFSKGHKEFFIMHRHFHCDIKLYTQVYNRIDKTIRDIVDRCYYIKKLIPFTFYYEIPSSIIIPEETGEIQQGYIKPTRLQKLLGIKIIYRPKYYKYFDSWYIRTNKILYDYEKYKV